MSSIEPDNLETRLAGIRAIASASERTGLYRALLSEIEGRVPPDLHGRARIHIELANTSRELGQVQPAIEQALEASRLAEATGDPTLRGRAILATSHIFFTSGLLEEARRRARLVLDIPDVSPACRTLAQVNIASSLRSEGSLVEAAEAFDLLLDNLDDQAPTGRASIRINAASCYHQVRRLDDAHRALALARLDLADQDAPQLDAWCDTIEAWVALRSGELPRGIQLARRGLDPARAGTNTDLRSSAARVLLQLAAQAGDVQAGLQAAQISRELVSRLETSGAMREATDLHESLASWHEHQGDLAGAVHHLRAMRGIEARTRTKAERMRLEREGIRSELLRAQVEADALRAGQDELNRASQALVAADYARANLLATLAHDLRNLLTTVTTSVELADPSNPVEMSRTLARLDEASRQMVAILDRALAPQGQPERPRVDLSEIVRRSAEAYADLIERRDQRIEVDAPEEILVPADETMLSRLVDNLLSNSVKYAPPSTVITLSVQADRRRARLIVADQGPGFPGVEPSDGMLFGHRLDREGEPEKPGHGVGLYAVYQLLAELGGILSIGNRAEGGAIVRVTLPRG